MPSKTPKQAKFMRAIAHGWTPSRMKSPPSRAVAQEFMEADRKYSGGFAENRYWTGGLAAMNEAHAGYKRGSLDFKWQEGGDVDYEENGMRRGGRVLSLDGRRAREYEPQRTIISASGTPITGPSGAEVTIAPTTAYSGPRLAGPRRGGGRRGGRGGRRNGGGPGPGPGPGPGGPGTAPPRIIPTDPASYIGVSAEEKEALKQSPYRDQLREHKAKIAATLGSARGGHVNYYQQGGAARAGHPEDLGKKGPNPWDPEEDTAAYNYWETRFHQEPPPPEDIVEDEVAEPGFLERWFGIKPEPANLAKTQEYLESIEQARGGRVGYQAGGLAIAAPRGGVPPWIEPVQEYQFGGIADRGAPIQPGRANPARAAVRPGGRRGLRGRMGQARQAYGLPTRGTPQGGLAAMYGRAQQQQQAQAGGLPPGIDPRAVAANPQGYARQQMEAARRGMGGPGGGGSIGLSPYEQMENQRRGPRGPMAPGGGGGPLQLPGGGGTPPWMGRDVISDYWGPPGGPGDPRTGGKRFPGSRIAPPPGKYPGGSGPYSPGGRDPRSFPAEGGGRSGTLGGPGYGPDPLGSAGPGGSLRGGPRVPPNMQGYLQKMRMQNRPPSGPVGGGGNRVGMQDQQGALSRALQRGTGRPPMSRRMAFGRGAQQ